MIYGNGEVAIGLELRDVCRYDACRNYGFQSAREK